MKRAVTLAAVFAALFLFLDAGSAQHAAAIRISATAAGDLRAWDGYVNQGLRSGALRVRRRDQDPAIPARAVERLQQFHDGVPVWGADLVRDAERGVPMAIFGEVSGDLTLDTRPQLTQDAAERRLMSLAGADATVLEKAQLTILRQDTGEHRLAYQSVVAGDGDVLRLFVDANTGAELLRHSEILTQSAVGAGRGVLGDEKKLSVKAEVGAYFADDQHRPPLLRTFDFRANVTRAVSVINGAPLLPSDRATDSDNQWTDASAVDAHVHVGWTYDYYFKRHGRLGLDGNNREIVALINAFTPEGALTAPPNLSVLVSNAFWCGACGPSGVGVMFFGNGIPSGFFYASTGQNVTPLAGSLDIAAHELTHGVIDSSSRLAFGNEPGALNEAFADILGTSVEFFFQSPGAARGQADYVIAEDSFRAQRPGSIDGIRSLAAPQTYAALPGLPNPDHYSRRYTGTLDDGGVHVNAGIPGNAFYLAIEGGTNRTSGLAVQGVGAANREQIEKVFYRAFVFLLPSSASFSTARAATIQAARDLYGVGSAPERAVTQAWTAVGVQ